MAEIKKYTKENSHMVGFQKNNCINDYQPVGCCWLEREYSNPLRIFRHYLDDMPFFCGKNISTNRGHIQCLKEQLHSCLSLRPTGFAYLICPKLLLGLLQFTNDSKTVSNNSLHLETIFALVSNILQDNGSIAFKNTCTIINHAMRVDPQFIHNKSSS